eukprot:c17636_g1_i2.p1 GENE.c17636_g1_i2~~c17636_g1_i2.p1  ORF type:complete len:189 (+),score=27.55 c17636_g1_i2:626-1192(+)
MRSNLLSGSIPPQLSTFANLQTLRLGHNSISGTLPNFDLLTSLVTLDVSSMLVVGAPPLVPSSATSIDLSNNQGLVGAMSAQYQNADVFLNVSMTAIQLPLSNPSSVCVVLTECILTGISAAECAKCTSKHFSVHAPRTHTHTTRPMRACVGFLFQHHTSSPESWRTLICCFFVVPLLFLFQSSPRHL